MPPPIPEMTNIQIVQFLAEGLVVKEISDATGTNARTIESRIKKLRKITGAKTSAHLVAKYYDLGLISLRKISE